MSRKPEWAKLVEDVVHKHIEWQVSAACGEPVKLSKRQVNAYCKAGGRIEHQREIECAIGLLESEGYRVIKPRRK